MGAKTWMPDIADTNARVALAATPTLDGGQPRIKGSQARFS